MPTPSIRATAHGHNGGTTAVDGVAIPAGAQNNDILLMAILTGVTGDPSISAGMPSGIFKIYDQGFNTRRLTIFAKIVDLSDNRTGYDFTLAVAGGTSWTSVCLYNTKMTDLTIGTTWKRTASGTGITAPGIAAPANSLVLTYMAEVTSAAETDYTSLTGVAEVVDKWIPAAIGTTGHIHNIVVSRIGSYETATTTGDAASVWPNAAANGLGVQIAFPYVRTDLNDPSVTWATTSSFGSTHLGVGARILDATRVQLRAIGHALTLRRTNRFPGDASELVKSSTVDVVDLGDGYRRITPNGVVGSKYLGSLNPFATYIGADSATVSVPVRVPATGQPVMAQLAVWPYNADGTRSLDEDAITSAVLQPGTSTVLTLQHVRGATATGIRVLVYVRLPDGSSTDHTNPLDIGPPYVGEAGAPFNGDTADAGAFRYRWTGTPGESTSEEVEAWDAAPVLGDPVPVVDPQGFVHAQAVGLMPDSDYTLELVDADRPDKAAVTLEANTLRTVKRSTFRVITGSCQRSSGAGEPGLVYNDMRLEEADFFVHQGDMHYRDAATEADWRSGMNYSLSAEAMRTFLKTTPMRWGPDNHDWGGNTSWDESPAGQWVPQLGRRIFGPYLDDIGFYGAWSHNGVRFIQTDQWSQRDQAVTDPSTDSLEGKTMLSNEQRLWLFNEWLTATEPLIVWFSSFPLYANVSNGRWGNFRWEVAQINAFLDQHPHLRRKIVAIGGDSHNVIADDGANTLFKIPSLNASPLDRKGDADSTVDALGWQGTWNIAKLAPDNAAGVYSRLDFVWPEPDRVTLNWEARREGGTRVASWSKTFLTPPAQTFADVYVGSTRASAMYVGDVLVWSP